jgi:hypothetical protein
MKYGCGSEKPVGSILVVVGFVRGFPCIICVSAVFSVA